MTVFEVPLVGPAGEPVDLARTLGSHGFAGLAPLRPDEDAGTLELTIRPRRGRPRRARVAPGPRDRAHVEILGPAAGPRVAAEVEAGVRHVLRLDQDLSGFYARAAGDPELSWVTSGAGRMLRSPTPFEDVVKTVCTTNCAWSATVRMVNALVANLGEPAIGGGDPLTNAFPTPEAMAGAPESFYRETVRSGYRGAYLIELATTEAGGDLDLESLAAASPDELPDDDLETRLLALPGVGPYAAAHIMMTMGRNHRLILDSWTRPAYARLRGRTRLVPDATIRRRFARYREHAGLAFWLVVTRDWIE
jgi:N-glycosylase/DNA lyase